MVNFFSSKSREVEVGHLKALWRDLGREVGSREIGLRRIEIAPEYFSTPAHEHGAEEEIFFVLSGDGLLWQGGETFNVSQGDCIVHRPRSGPHTMRASQRGLDVLVFGERHDASLTALPRAQVAWSFPQWVGLPGGDHPFAREAAAGAPECPPPGELKPSNLINLEDAKSTFGGLQRKLGESAGAISTGLNYVALPADQSGAPAHCHSLEEELFVVFSGTGKLLLWPRGADTPEEHDLHEGDVISRPAGTGIAHSLRAGPGGLTYLAYGTRRSNDMCFYPQSGRVSLRGLGIALSSPEIEFLPGP